MTDDVSENRLSAWYDLFSRGARDWLRHNQKVRSAVRESLPEILSGDDVISKPTNRNVLVLSRYLMQVMEPGSLSALGLDVAAFKAFAIKSRVHFRRGFDDSGFARTILLVEPVEPFLGTVRLEGLPYQNVDLKKFYPYGEPQFP